MITTIIIIAIVVILVFWFISAYNKLIRLRAGVDESFSGMDIYMKKRYDLIPNLVETVKGYAKHERETLEEVIKARNSYMTASSITDKIESSNQITGALSKLFALSESYPELKANSNFLSLQDDLRKIEDDIANARKYYNGNVKIYNTTVQSVPTNILAGLFKFKEYPYFELDNKEERVAPKVQF